MRFIIIAAFAIAFAGAGVISPARADPKKAAQTASDNTVCPCPPGTSPNGDNSCFNRGNGENGQDNGNGHQGGNNGNGKGNSDNNRDKDQCKSRN